MAFPTALQRWTFQGTANQSGVILGATGATGVNRVPYRSPSNNGALVAMATTDIPVQWEIKNDSDTDDLYFLFGNYGDAIALQAAIAVAEIAPAMSPRAVLTPGQAYYTAWRHPRQQLAGDAETDEPQESFQVLVLLSSGNNSHPFSGAVSTYAT